LEIARFAGRRRRTRSMHRPGSSDPGNDISGSGPIGLNLQASRHETGSPHQSDRTQRCRTLWDGVMNTSCVGPTRSPVRCRPYTLIVVAQLRSLGSKPQPSAVARAGEPTRCSLRAGKHHSSWPTNWGACVEECQSGERSGTYSSEVSPDFDRTVFWMVEGWARGATRDVVQSRSGSDRVPTESRTVSRGVRGDDGNKHDFLLEPWTGVSLGRCGFRGILFGTRPPGLRVVCLHGAYMHGSA